MNVKELKELLKDAPDDYEIRSRSQNAYNRRDDDPNSVSWSRRIGNVHISENAKTVMLIGGGWE